LDFYNEILSQLVFYIKFEEFSGSMKQQGIRSNINQVVQNNQVTSENTLILNFVGESMDLMYYYWRRLIRLGPMGKYQDVEFQLARASNKMKNLSDDSEKPSWPWLISSLEPASIQSLLQYNDFQMVWDLLESVSSNH
jgi:hypothetical protein